MANSRQVQQLAALLSQKYPTEQLDINQDVIRPPSIPNTPWTGVNSPWGSPPTIVNPPGPIPGADEQAGDGGRGDTTSGQMEGAGYGKMSPGMRAGVGVAGTLAGLAGALPASVALGLLGKISDQLPGFVSNPLSGVMTPEGIQNEFDYSGNIAGQAAQDARNAAEAARAAAVGPGIMGGDALGPGGPDPGWGSSTPSTGFGAGEEATSGLDGGGNGGSGGGIGAGDTGGGGEGGGGYGGGGEALGGVHKTVPGQPRWAVYGEKEPETAIFIPDMMKKMGMQGREQEVIQALQTMLRMLKGNQKTGSKPPASESAAIEKKEAANGGRRN